MLLLISSEASTRGAFGAVEGGKSVMRSTFPTRTPAKRTSDPSRRPLASLKRALRWSFLAKGLMSPEAFRMSNIRMIIEPSTSNPTRNSLRLTDFLDFGIAHNQRMKDEG